MKRANNKITLSKALTGLFIFLMIVLLIWSFIPKPVPVSISTVKRRDYQQFIEEDGKTRAKNIFTVYAPVTGEMARIAYVAGDTVRKDQVLTSITPSVPTLLDNRTILVLEKELYSQQASVSKAESMVARAKAAFVLAKSELKRKKPLYQERFISPAEFDQAQAEFEVKQKEYEAAVADLNASEHRVELIKAAMKQRSLTKLSLSQSKEGTIVIRSPENARILKIVRKSAGDIKVGESILELADVRDLEIVTDMLSTDAVKIPENAKVIIKHWGGQQSLLGRVRLVEPRGFTKRSALGVEEQRVNVVIDFVSPKNEWEKLGTGYHVDVAILLFQKNNALTVPVSALFRDKKHWAVFVIKSSKAKLQRIVIQSRNPEYAVVTKGLSVGDKVINYPSDQIVDGVRVEKSKSIIP